MLGKIIIQRLRFSIDYRVLLWANSAACLGPASIRVNVNAVLNSCTHCSQMRGVLWRRGAELPFWHGLAPLSGTVAGVEGVRMASSTA